TPRRRSRGRGGPGFRATLAHRRPSRKLRYEALSGGTADEYSADRFGDTIAWPRGNGAGSWHSCRLAIGAGQVRTQLNPSQRETAARGRTEAEDRRARGDGCIPLELRVPLPSSTGLLC